jgi:hypothetical protein
MPPLQFKTSRSQDCSINVSSSSLPAHAPRQCDFSARVHAVHEQAQSDPAAAVFVGSVPWTATSVEQSVENASVNVSFTAPVPVVLNSRSEHVDMELDIAEEEAPFSFGGDDQNDDTMDCTEDMDVDCAGESHVQPDDAMNVADNADFAMDIDDPMDVDELGRQYANGSIDVDLLLQHASDMDIDSQAEYLDIEVDDTMDGGHGPMDADCDSDEMHIDSTAVPLSHTIDPAVHKLALKFARLTVNDSRACIDELVARFSCISLEPDLVDDLACRFGALVISNDVDELVEKLATRFSRLSLDYDSTDDLIRMFASLDISDDVDKLVEKFQQFHI